MSRNKYLFASLLIVLLAINSIILPATLAHGDQPCEIGTLVEEQTVTFQLLENFANIANDDFDAALEALWHAGHSLEHMAEECGFVPPESTAPAETLDVSAEEMAAHETVEIPDEEAIMEFATSIGNPAHGEELFHTFTQTGFACATCHRNDSTDRLVGPGLLGVAYRQHQHGDMAMGETGEGEEAGENDEHAAEEEHVVNLPFELGDDPLVSRESLEYIYTSITNPSAVVVEGFPDNLMPKTFREVFSDEDLSDIIAYLVTLRPETDE
jgi:hypothetical protein